jgi:hypothetical protein
MSQHWPPDVAAAVGKALGAAADRLSHLEARVERYAVSECGYAPFTGGVPSDVFSLEARMGPAHRKPGFSMRALFQVFDPGQPNLALLRVVEQRDRDGLPTEDHRVPVYNPQLDRALSGVFVPVVNSALNGLDPGGGNRSLHVGVYHGRVAPSDLLTASKMALDSFRRFRVDGQPAIIWVDFHDPVAVPAVRLVKAVAAPRDVHLIPRGGSGSAATVPVRGTAGRAHHVGGMSVAVDQGIAIARRYLAAQPALQG